MSVPVAVKLKTQGKRDLIAKLAKEDNDNMNIPTHAILKGDEIVGGWNLCEVPMVLLWHDSKKVTAKDSLLLNALQESMLSQIGVQQSYIACNSHSPYYKHMHRFGFEPVWETNLFFKDLKKIGGI